MDDVNIFNNAHSTRDQINLKCISQRLKNILHSPQFCGLCLKTEDLYSIKSVTEIFINGSMCSMPLKEIIDEVFQDVQNILTASYMCGQCTDKTIQSYVFIENTKMFTRIINNYICNLYNKTVELNNQLDQKYNYSNSKFVIVVENNPEINEYNITVGEEETEINLFHNRLDSEDEISEGYVTKIDLKSIENKDVETFQDITTLNKITLDNVAPGTIEREITETDHALIQKAKANNKVLKVSKSSKAKSISLQKILKPLKTKEGAYKCIECDVVLVTFKQWKVHKHTYHKIPIPQCQVCFQTFKSNRNLVKHYTVHNRTLCKTCYGIIPEIELADHLISYHGNVRYSCEYCKLTFCNSTLLDTHVKTSHSTSGDTADENPRCLLCLKDCHQKSHQCKFHCPDCTDIPCIHDKYLISYRKQVLNHETKIKCVDCDYVCLRKDLLIGHANREHLNHHPFKCDICGIEYFFKGTLRTHIMKLHLENYTCEYCDQKFMLRSLFDDHVEVCKLDRREIKCMQCEASFDTPEKLSNHIFIRHEKDIPCSLCTNKFSTQAKLEEHKLKTHRSVQIVNKLRKWECSICDRNFSLRGEYQNHMKTHGKGCKYPCKRCNLEFESTRKLDRHNRLKHDLRVQCKVCRIKMEKTLLESHMQKHSSNGTSEFSSFTCESCGKCFTSYFQLSTHRKTHLEPVPCQICKKLVKATTLPSHMSRHKYGGMRERKKVVLPRNFKCSYCNKYFTKTLLEGHTNKYHLKIKPYACDICGVAYSCKYQLNEHKTHHSEENWFTCPVCGKTLRHKRPFKKHLMIHTGERPHICEKCGDSFISIDMLKHHILKHEAKTVTCPLCHSKYYTVKEVRSHIKKCHWKIKGRPFDYKEIQGLAKEHYYLFKDGRRAVVDSD